MARKKKGQDGEPMGSDPKREPSPTKRTSKPKGRPKASARAEPVPQPEAAPKPPKAKPATKPKPTVKSKANAPASKPAQGRKKGSRAAPSQRSRIETLMLQAFDLGESRDRTGDPVRNRALEFLDRAYDADDPAEVTALALQALQAWPDCADAYVLLAEVARGPKESLSLYEKGMEAGARVVGPAAFRKAEGHFWMLQETRPYMRARFGLAQVLWVLGRRDEAVAHYDKLLRLNPNDNQGVRYILAACLLELGRDGELGDLLLRYGEDGSANWSYSTALLAFRLEGNSPNARALLKTARRANKFVPDLLTGRERLPSRLPDAIGIGDVAEAVDYVTGFLRGWRATTGALAWVRTETEAKKPGRSKAGKPRGKGATVASKTRLKRLPLRDVVWQAEARRMPVWVSDGGDLRRPWVVLVASLTDSLILSQALLDDAPTPALLWDVLSAAMHSPSAGTAHIPSEVAVRPGGLWDGMISHLDEVGVALVHEDDLDLIDHLMDDLVENVFGSQGGPALLDMPLVSPEIVAGFYRAAADYYRAAPWQRITGDETIKVNSDQFESGPWYAVVIGQMGMTLGLALYEDLDALVRMRDGDASDEQNARETVALSVTFGDETETPVLDLDAAERHGWDLAGPDAYPAPMRKERGLVMRPPLAWELRLLEGCLGAIPDFVAEHDRDDPAASVVEVPTASGPLTLQLSWVKG